MKKDWKLLTIASVGIVALVWLAGSLPTYKDPFHWGFFHGAFAIILVDMLITLKLRKKDE